jgi:hypothetical protein
MITSFTIPVLRKRAIDRGFGRHVAAAVLLGFSGCAAAHEGHHHDTAPAPAAPPLPALAADTPQIELVVKRQQDQVVFYVDDYASNAPLDGLQLEVHDGSRVLQAAPAGEGVYQVPADLLGAGAQALQIVVRGRGVEAAVPGELPAAPAAAASLPAASQHRAWPWLATAAAAVLLLPVLGRRIRRRALTA